jgi:hypothetical protein
VPASNNLHVELPSDFAEGQFRIIDQTGRILNSGVISGGPILEIGVSELRPGVYILELTDRSGVRRKRFMKE